MNQTAVKPARILVIEDDPDTQELISLILADAGYACLSALDGEEGLRRAHEERPDLILLDIMLPRLDGLEVCRLLAAHADTRGIPVIIVTAKQELSTKLSSFVAGARRFISKPFTSQELVTEIERTLRQRDLTVRFDTPPRDSRN